MSTPPVSANMLRSIIWVPEADTDATGKAAGYGNAHQCTSLTIHTTSGTLLHAALRPTIERHTSGPSPVAHLTTFRNRTAEIASLHQDIASGHRRQVYGASGSGVSLLLRRMTDTPPARLMSDGVVYVAGESEPPVLEDVWQRLFDRFYTSDVAIKVTPAMARVYLGRLQALVVLDRLPLPPDDLRWLVESLASSAVFIGSPATALDTLPASYLRGLPSRDAVELCMTTAHFDAPSTRMVTLLERLCTTLGNLPLPVLLVAHLLDGSAEQVEGLLKRLEPLAAEHPPLACALTLLLAALSDEERTTLAAIVGVGGTDVSGEVLVAVSRQQPEVLERTLPRLLGLGLVVRQGTRFAIRSPGMRSLLEETLQPVHEQWQATMFFAAEIALRAGDMDWIEQELGNLLAAAHIALARGEMALLGRLTRGLQPFVVLRGLWGLWERVIEWAERAAQVSGDRKLYAWALHERGTYAGIHGNYRVAAVALTEAQRVRRQAGDEAGAAASQHNLTYLSLLFLPGRSQAAERSTPVPRGWARLSAGQWMVGALPVVLLLLSIGLHLLFPDWSEQIVTVSQAPLATATATSTPLPTDTATPSFTPTASGAGTVPPPYPISSATPSPSSLPAPTATSAPAPPGEPTAPPIEPTVLPVEPPAPPDVPTATIPLPPVATSTLLPTSTPLLLPATPTLAPSPTPVPTTALPTSTLAPIEPTATEVPPSPTAEGTATTTATPTLTQEPLSPVLLAPELLEPSDESSQACGDSVLLRWEGATDDDTIDVVYAWEVDEATSDEEEAEYTDFETGRTETTSDRLLDLTCDRWYRWRVRGIDEDELPGPFSEYARFYVEAQATPTPTPTPDITAPEPPELVAPRNDQILACDETVRFVWNESEDPAGIDIYELEILRSNNEDGSGGYRFYRALQSTTTSIALSNFECPFDTTWYRWKVRAIDSEGNEGDYSGTQTFRLEAEP